MELSCVFSRRAEHLPSLRAPVYSNQEVEHRAELFDVLLICSGSAEELPQDTPRLARFCNVVDSFDTHEEIPSHFARVDQNAQKSNRLALISAGWDPGLFSLCRLLFGAVFPNGDLCTLWGRGVSQGHSDAIRRVNGVLDARQYTVPDEEALEQFRQGKALPTSQELHRRECYVVAQAGADLARIEREIKEMPHYFAPYRTEVHFVSKEVLERNHSALSHGGRVIAKEEKMGLELSMQTASNPDLTARLLLIFARAVHRMHQKGVCGCITPFDVPLRFLLEKDGFEML